MLPSILSRCLPLVARRVELRSPIQKILIPSCCSIPSRNVSNYAKHNPESVSTMSASDEKVDATILVAKDLAKMFEEIHQELESEIRHEIELTEMSK